jgi:ribokinase
MARILVLGSLNMDLVVTVPHLPRPGETVLGAGLGRYPGGKGANQAIAAARLGGQVALVGRVGGDDFGPGLVENLKANGVDASGVKPDHSSTTGAALIFVGPEGQNMIAVAPGANARLDAADAQRAVERLGPGDVLVMQLEIAMPVIIQAALAARRAGARVLLNAAPAQRVEPGLLDQVDTLVVNEGEARALVVNERVARDHDVSPEAAAAALKAMGPRFAVVTLGAAGSVFCDETGVHRVEPFQVTSVDATGAGDAFVGALAVGLARGLATQAIMRFANAAGAAATTSLGAQAALPRPEDLRRLFGLDLSFSEP